MINLSIILYKNYFLFEEFGKIRKIILHLTSVDIIYKKYIFFYSKKYFFFHEGNFVN